MYEISPNHLRKCWVGACASASLRLLQGVHILYEHISTLAFVLLTLRDTPSFSIIPKFLLGLQEASHSVN